MVSRKSLAVIFAVCIFLTQCEKAETLRLKRTPTIPQETGTRLTVNNATQTTPLTDNRFGQRAKGGNNETRNRRPEYGAEIAEGISANEARGMRRSNVPESANEYGSVSRLQRSKTFVTWLAAFVQTFIKGINCKAARRYFTSEARCEMVKRTPFHNMRFYGTQRELNAVYSVAIPEGRLRDLASHHAVAVVDPFPSASFGHLVLVFYVDGMTKLACFERKGLYMGDNLCISQARRFRCRNHFRNQLTPDQVAKKCEINFIPTVYNTQEEGPTRVQQLECIPYLAGFGSCPLQLATESEIIENCELQANSKRCYVKESKAPEARLPLCRLYARCDHAVTLFGGWNDVTMFTRHEDHLQRFYTMLKRNGFKKQNIQVFYNGNGNVPLGDSYRHGLPASSKNAIRNHITTLCRSAVCVDSFVIYLNGPTTSDGSILLWDNNGDGEAQPTEAYSVDEFLDDVTDCEANHLFVFAEQSYAGIMTSRMRARIQNPVYPGTRASWSRVVLLSSGGEFEYSWGDDVIRHWTGLSPMLPVSWAYDNIGYTHSTTNMLQKRRAQEYTLYGAPIIYGLPVLAENPTELRREYMGCQDLPAAEWILEFNSEFNEASPE